MKIKRSLAVLFIAFIMLFALPTLAFAADSGSVGQTITLTFDNLFYVTILCGVLALVFLIVAIVMSVRHAKQKKLVCKNYQCSVNPLVVEDLGGTYDFRGFETPQELMRYQPHEDAGVTQPPQQHIQPPQNTQYGQPVYPMQQSQYAQPDQYAQPPQAMQYAVPAQAVPYGQSIQYAPYVQPERNTMDFTLDMIERVLANLQTKTIEPESTSAPAPAQAAALAQDPTPDRKSDTQDLGIYSGRHFKADTPTEHEAGGYLQPVPDMKHVRTYADSTAQQPATAGQSPASQDGGGGKDAGLIGRKIS